MKALKAIWSRCYCCHKPYFINNDDQIFCDNECQELSENEINLQIKKYYQTTILKIK